MCNAHVLRGQLWAVLYPCAEGTTGDLAQLETALQQTLKDADVDEGGEANGIDFDRFEKLLIKESGALDHFDARLRREPKGQPKGSAPPAEKGKGSPGVQGAPAASPVKAKESQGCRCTIC
jgi:hypothetical protein